jgi:hypothetical protein
VWLCVRISRLVLNVYSIKTSNRSEATIIGKCEVSLRDADDEFCENCRTGRDEKGGGADIPQAGKPHKGSSPLSLWGAAPPPGTDNLARHTGSGGSHDILTASNIVSGLWFR